VLSDCQPWTIRSRQSEDEVNMIAHHTVHPHLDRGLARLLNQQISINLLVAVLKKLVSPSPIPPPYLLRFECSLSLYHHVSAWTP
jgi:hypothetical protein